MLHSSDRPSLQNGPRAAAIQTHYFIIEPHEYIATIATSSETNVALSLPRARIISYFHGWLVVLHTFIIGTGLDHRDRRKWMRFFNRSYPVRLVLIRRIWMHTNIRIVHMCDILGKTKFIFRTLLKLTSIEKSLNDMCKTIALLIIHFWLFKNFELYFDSKL